ncbi:hypothetical protein D3C72_2077110 [compost metagenome]
MSSATLTSRVSATDSRSEADRVCIRASISARSRVICWIWLSTVRTSLASGVKRWSSRVRSSLSAAIWRWYSMLLLRIDCASRLGCSEPVRAR